MLPELPYPELELRRLFGRGVQRLERLLERETDLDQVQLLEVQVLTYLLERLFALLYPSVEVHLDPNLSEEEGHDFGL